MNRDIQKAIEEVKTAEIKYFSYQEPNFYKHKSDKSTYCPQTKYAMVKNTKCITKYVHYTKNTTEQNVPVNQKDLIINSLIFTKQSRLPTAVHLLG